MLIDTKTLLTEAQEERYAVGAFNIYNLEGATAVVRTAEKMRSPVMLQILPVALALGGKPLVSLCRTLAEEASVPVGLHLDHCPSRITIDEALESGISSIMADGSDLDFGQNIRFTRDIVAMTKIKYVAGCVEAELGKLSGSEDGIEVSERKARMTDPDQAASFVNLTGIDALAVCIGNVHGKYPDVPQLDFARLREISEKVSVPLVLHGTSGLPDHMISRAIDEGVCKFNVNTEVRSVYLDTMKEMCTNGAKVELINIMENAMQEMAKPIQEKIKLFCSAGRA